MLAPWIDHKEVNQISMSSFCQNKAKIVNDLLQRSGKQIVIYYYKTSRNRIKYRSIQLHKTGRRRSLHKKIGCASRMPKRKSDDKLGRQGENRTTDFLVIQRTLKKRTSKSDDRTKISRLISTSSRESRRISDEPLTQRRI